MCEGLLRGDCGMRWGGGHHTLLSSLWGGGKGGRKKSEKAGDGGRGRKNFGKSNENIAPYLRPTRTLISNSSTPPTPTR